jgi:ribonuclease BN (tRNA processing enzyme)
MRVIVLGGLGAYPTAAQGCNGFLVEHDGFRLVVDPGYATIQPLLSRVDATDVDAVWVSHGHPDHCADLQPLVRERALVAQGPPAVPLPPLPVYAQVGALGPVLGIDQPGTIDDAYTLHEVDDGDEFEVGPFWIAARELPHMVPNLGVRITAGGSAVAYTGDCGPSEVIADLAADVDLLIANATFPDEIPPPRTPNLSSARQAGEYATAANANALLLFHLWPGVPPQKAVAAARATYDGPVDVATQGLTLDV